mmetsp:Transcript_20003/g.69441  ORF Transcript_20003/g.69441 Transcript_20003/m.69441 type:complete len:159 (+) Transcript_20003:255-731(+)
MRCCSVRSSDGSWSDWPTACALATWRYLNVPPRLSFCIWRDCIVLSTRSGRTPSKAAGLSDETVEALRLGRRPPTLEPDEAAALDLATALLEGSGGGEAVSDDAYRAAVQVLGERGVFEIVTLTGFYTTLARVVNAFRVPVPTGEPRPFEGGPPASRL